MFIHHDDELKKPAKTICKSDTTKSFAVGLQKEGIACLHVSIKKLMHSA